MGSSTGIRRTATAFPAGDAQRLDHRLGAQGRRLGSQSAQASPSADTARSRSMRSSSTNRPPCGASSRRCRSSPSGGQLHRVRRRRDRGRSLERAGRREHRPRERHWTEGAAPRRRDRAHRHPLRDQPAIDLAIGHVNDTSSWPRCTSAAIPGSSRSSCSRSPPEIADAPEGPRAFGLRVSFTADPGFRDRRD